MTTQLRLLARKPSFFLGSLALTALMTFVVGRWYDLSRDQWPAWVQAVGSVLAILSAVWIPWQQSESTREAEELREQEAVRGMLRSIRAEIESALSYTKMEIGKALNAQRPGEAIRDIFPVAENSFPIFDAFIPRLCAIPNDDLRENIVSTFAVARGFVLTVRFHNELGNALNEAEIRARQAPSFESNVALMQAQQNLASYSSDLRHHYTVTRNAAEALILQLRRY